MGFAPWLLFRRRDDRNAAWFYFHYLWIRASVDGLGKRLSGKTRRTFAQEVLYRVVRHPQYTGIMLAVFGQIVHWPAIIALALFSVIVLVYIRLAYKEEKAMIARFDDTYKNYMQRVPMFFPRWTVWGRLVDAIGT